MANTGSPRSDTPDERRGACATRTDAGPPDRISARAPDSLIRSEVAVPGRISQYTPSSRTVRAMSWVYCEPKSKMRSWAFTLLIRAVVGRFLGDEHVVNMALSQPGRSDADELRFFLQLANRSDTTVAHSGAQAADELVDR